MPKSKPIPKNIGNITSEEDNEIAKIIRANERRIQFHEGPLYAEWLLTNWESPVWITYGGKKTRKVEGLWKGTVDINWQEILPNGKRLTDPDYQILLEASKRIAFLYREGIGSNKPPAISSWKGFMFNLLSICKWLVLNEKRFCPEKMAFSQIDQYGLKQLFRMVGEGGWTYALRIAERVIDEIHFRTYGIPCPGEVLENPESLPEKMREDMIEWLSNNEAYITSADGKCMLSRRFIASIVPANRKSFTNAGDRFNAICRQLEPDLAHPRGLFLPYRLKTEFPSHRTLPVNQAMSTPASPSLVKYLSLTFYNMALLERYLPNFLPPASAWNIEECRINGIRASSPFKRTPLVPMEIGFKYLNEAIRWIHCYGDTLVKYIISIFEWAKIISKGSISKQSIITSHRTVEVPEELKKAGFMVNEIGNSGVKRDYRQLRSCPTFHQIIKIWVGAVVTVIGMLKPSRDSEISQLNRDCLLGQGPYWLDTDLAKRGTREYRERTGGKPIPIITAKAIRQLQKLGEKLSILVNEQDPYKRSRLFYLPDLSDPCKPLTPMRQDLNFHLDIFCDYVDVPPDNLGRRWYLRMHEMRKWFLLHLFWTGRHGVLDAARDIAGHTDIKHLYHYIEREFPHEEFSKLEAEYAVDRLRRYEENGVCNEGEKGLIDLYKRVLDHFRVETVELIPEKSWHQYIQELQKTEGFFLEPYSVVDDQGNSITCIAFRSGGITP